MIRLAAGRIALGVLTVFVVSILIFIGTTILPGDVATAVLGQSATPDAVEAIRRSLGLTIPPSSATFRWLGAFLTGDMGASLASRRPVGPDLWIRLKNTFFLAGMAALVAVPLALLLGIATAMLPQQLVRPACEHHEPCRDLAAGVLRRLSAHPARLRAARLAPEPCHRLAGNGPLRARADDRTAGADAHARRPRLHDAHDPHRRARRHVPPLYRDGGAQGRAARAAWC